MSAMCFSSPHWPCRGLDFASQSGFKSSKRLWACQGTRDGWVSPELLSHCYWINEAEGREWRPSGFQKLPGGSEKDSDSPDGRVLGRWIFKNAETQTYFFLLLFWHRTPQKKSSLSVRNGLLHPQWSLCFRSWSQSSSTWWKKPSTRGYESVYTSPPRYGLFPSGALFYL